MICNSWKSGINLFENAEKLVTFVGINLVIKESEKQRFISKRERFSTQNYNIPSTLAVISVHQLISEFNNRKVDGGMPKRMKLLLHQRYNVRSYGQHCVTINSFRF